MSKTFNADELKARYNPEGSLLRRQQNRMTEMLLCFDEICRKHDIPYWLCSGTLLGCVRHGGYIPWDDDLDVEILYKDYNRLMKVLRDELPEQYDIQNDETDSGYFFCFAKLRDKRSYLEESNRYDRIFQQRGIFIDIFTYEKMPPLLHWISCRSHGFVYKVMKNPEYNDQQAKRKVRKILAFNKSFVFPLLRAIAMLWPTKQLRYSPGIPYDNTIYADETFPLAKAKFEGYDMPVPCDSHAYLTRKFGDYMKLPNLDTLHPHADKMTIEED